MNKEQILLKLYRRRDQEEKARQNPSISEYVWERTTGKIEILTDLISEITANEED